MQRTKYMVHVMLKRRMNEFWDRKRFKKNNPEDPEGRKKKHQSFVTYSIIYK